MTTHTHTRQASRMHHTFSTARAGWQLRWRSTHHARPGNSPTRGSTRLPWQQARHTVALSWLIPSVSTLMGSRSNASALKVTQVNPPATTSERRTIKVRKDGIITSELLQQWFLSTQLLYWNTRCSSDKGTGLPAIRLSLANWVNETTSKVNATSTDGPTFPSTAGCRSQQTKTLTMARALRLQQGSAAPLVGGATGPDVQRPWTFDSILTRIV
jgi:hypothetical protein